VTVSELFQALEGVNLDAAVELELWDDDEEGEGEYDEMTYSDIGSINYNAETNTVTLTEAS
jgi:hypothetical protein